VSDASWEEQVAKSVWPLQIIVAALVAGCGFFLVIVLAVGGPAAGNAGDERPLVVSYLALAFLVAVIAARCIVPVVIVRTGRRNIAQGTFPTTQTPARDEPQPSPSPERDAAMLLTLFQAKTIVGAALIEGVAFFMLIAYMVERFTPILAVAVVLILVIAAHMPTRSGVVHWIEDQLRLVDEERSMGR
jgi:hypothetical protein